MIRSIGKISRLASALRVVYSMSRAESSGITEMEVVAAQKAWSDGIIDIGAVMTAGGDYKTRASSLLDSLYGAFPGVLFKPTKAAAVPFRKTRAEALSYFVTGDVPEDGGFAITPWSKIEWANSGFIIGDSSATAMGGAARVPPRKKKNRARAKKPTADRQLLVHAREDGRRRQGRVHVPARARVRPSYRGEEQQNKSQVRARGRRPAQDHRPPLVLPLRGLRRPARAARPAR